MTSPSDIHTPCALIKDRGGIHRLTGTASGLYVAVAGKKAVITTDGASDREREQAFIAAASGLEPRRVIILSQVHGDVILHLNDTPARAVVPYGTGDGMITALPHLCLVIRTADCVPLFVFDTNRRILGAVHAGWRGARIGIAGKLIREMRRVHRCDPADLEAYLLPSIGPSSYEVGPEVAAFFPDDARSRGNAYLLDLWGAIERQLIREGMPEGRIHNVRICTMEDHTEFHSWRRGDEGRNLNFAYFT